MDADDLWHPDKLKLQSELFEKAPEVEFVFCDAWQFRGEETILNSFLVTRQSFSKLPRHAVGENLYVFNTDMSAAMMHVNYVVTTSTAMVKRRAALEVGGFDPSMRVCEDYEFWLRVLKGRQAGVVNFPLVGYRHHGESLSDDRVAMVRGRIEVATRVFANPVPFPERAVAFFKGEEARRYAQLGRMDLHQGHFAQARANLWQSFRRTPTLSTAALLSGSLFGRPGRDILLAIKRTLGIKIIKDSHISQKSRMLDSDKAMAPSATLAGICRIRQYMLLS